MLTAGRGLLLRREEHFSALLPENIETMVYRYHRPALRTFEYNPSIGELGRIEAHPDTGIVIALESVGDIDDLMLSRKEDEIPRALGT